MDPTTTLNFYLREVRSLALSSNAALIVTASGNEGAVVREWRSRRVLLQIPVEDEPGSEYRFRCAYGVAMSADQNLLFVGDTSGRGFLVRIATHQAECATLALLGRPLPQRRRSSRLRRDSSPASVVMHSAFVKRFILDVDGDHAIWSRVFGFLLSSWEEVRVPNLEHYG